MADQTTLRTQYKVADFVGWQRSGTLLLNPNFQRRPVWKKGAKSFLIDTILRGLPMPIIFLREMRSDLKSLETRRDVVDGQQRIRTILSFVDVSLVEKLADFDRERDIFTIEAVHNEGLAGFSFADLSAADRQKILDYQFSVHSFPADTDDRTILQIFARMNSTGVKLNAQELRNAEYFGRFKTLAYDLATEQLNRWRNWKVFSVDQIARMLEVEMTSEFMILIMTGTLEKNKKTINDIYEENEAAFPGAKEVARRFRETFDLIDNSFTDVQIEALFSNRSIFFALFAALYGMQYSFADPDDEYHGLKREKPKSIKGSVITHIVGSAQHIANETAPQDVLKNARGSTAHAASRSTLIGYLAGRENDPCRAGRR